MSDLTAIVPNETPDARREMLEEQFSKIEAVEAPLERARDEKGQFAAKPVDPPVEAPDPPAWHKAPASWKKDYHEDWAASSDRMKEYAWQREEQMRAGIQPFMEKARFADSMNAVIEPHLNTMRGLGIEPDQAVKALLEADHVLRYSSAQEKLNYFAQLAQNYGVNLGQMQPQQQQVNPQYHDMINQINSVRGELAGWKQDQEHRQNQSLLGEINQFSQKSEHFEEMRPTMIQLLQSGVAQTLEEAYDKAIRLTPEIFDAIRDGKQAEQDASRKAAADSAAKRARAAAVSVKGSTPGTPTVSKAQDRRSMLSEQFDAINERM